MLRKAIAKGLREACYAVDEAIDGEAAIQFLHTYSYEVVLLDLMLPKADGFDVLRFVRRKHPSTRVLIVTAKSKVDDRIEGLDHGADDYLVKPFELSELFARVRALVRRSYCIKDNELRVGDLILSATTRTAERFGEKIELSEREYAILRLLMLRSGTYVSKQEIIDTIYESDEIIESNVVEAFIRLVRRKIERDGHSALLHTRRGQGYMLAEKSE